MHTCAMFLTQRMEPKEEWPKKHSSKYKMQDGGPQTRYFSQLEEVQMRHLSLFMAGSCLLTLKMNSSVQFTIWVPDLSDELHLRRP